MAEDQAATAKTQPSPPAAPRKPWLQRPWVAPTLSIGILLSTILLAVLVTATPAGRALTAPAADWFNGSSIEERARREETRMRVLLDAWGKGLTLDPDVADAFLPTARSALDAVGIDERVIGVRQSGAPGWHEIVHVSGPTLITENGRHLLQGRLVDLESGLDLTQVRRSEVDYARAIASAALKPIAPFSPPQPVPAAASPTVSPSPAPKAEGPPLALDAVRDVLWSDSVSREIDTIDFTAEDERLQAYVFSRPDCPHCQRLHQALPELNAAGVTLRYVFSPATESERDRLLAALCAPDPAEAVHALYEGGTVPDGPCASPDGARAQLTQHLTIGELAQVTSVPTFFPSGNRPAVTGFESAEALIAAWR